MMPSRTIIFLCVTFWVVWLALLPTRLSVPIEGDGLSYTRAASNLAHALFYSQDGVDPFVEREPGQSLFLFPVYAAFGPENHGAAYFAQALLFFCAACFFFHALRSILTDRARTIVLAFLLLFPAIFHVNYSLTRESLALSCNMLLFAGLIHFFRMPSWKLGLLLGGLLGFLLLTYAPFLLLPIPFVALLLWYRIPKLCIASVVAGCVLVLFPWGLRNSIMRGKPCLTGCTRTAVTWYVRGEQAKHIHGMEPLRCLYAEYISRDWNGLSPACNFNAVMHRRWPDGFMGREDDLLYGAQGRSAIGKHFWSYLWFSVFEVVELHLPYVNGWGFVYNLLAVFVTLLAYVGCCLSVPMLLKRMREPLLAFMAVSTVYTVGIFALTDALPRYLIPVIFCYLMAAGMGYDALLLKFSSWRK